MHYLVVVETVTDAAAICDYLQREAGSGDDVLAVTVHPPDASTPDSDRQEALNVVRVRLAGPTVETSEHRGPVDDELAAVLEAQSVDEIVVGSDTDVRASGLDGAAVPVVTVPPDS